tara:strand:- start:2596 stop:2715 length:120 start_codon:yes stop_codon:yes gene_type:complete
MLNNMENLNQQELLDKVLSGQLTQEEFDNLIYRIMEMGE